MSDTPSLAQQVTPTFKKPKIRHNLPSQSTPFFGRDSELQKLNGFINNPEIKLVTIVGPGGIGKTRLALEIARHQVDNFERGVWIVSLTKLAAVEEIVPAIAQALNMSFFGGGTPKQQLLDYLRNKSLFLVIDNFEHLLAGVRLVSEIIQNAPQIKILVTSREPLRLYEEQIFPLDGLTYTPECVHEADAAVQLFLNRACRQRPNLTLASADLPPMTTICRQVEGLPLGLELAAAWVDVLSLVDIADELQQSLDLLETDLRNVSERHQSLRTVFDASWQRLQEDERRLFAQLSIFRGGFTREAARQICAPDANHASFHRQLAALTRKSFLTYEPDIGRYFIHELMRQYGVEKLAEDGERATTVHHRHAAYYCEYFQLLYKELNGPRQKEAVKEIEADLENGRAAWNWVANHKMLDKIQKIILFWDRFLVIWRSRYQESDNLYATLIENLDEAKSILAQQLLIQALICRAKSKFCLGQHEEWDRLRQRAQKFFFQSPIDEIELWPGKSFVLRTLYSSDLNKRKEWCQQGLEIARRMDDRLEERVCLLILGDIANDQGKFDEAKELFEEFMEMVNLIGSRQSLGDALSRLSTIALRQYRFEEAIQLANEGIAAYSEFEDQAGVAACLYRLGDSYLYRGQYIKAIKAHCDSLNLSEEIGYQNEVTRSHFRLSHAYLHAGEYRKSKAMAETFQQMEKGNNYHRANALTMLGNNAMIEKNDSTTASYFAESKAIMPTTTGPIDLIWHQGYHVVALVHCKKLDEARQVIVDALRLKVLAPTGIILFAAIALFYWADNQWERAIELYALACKNPYAGKSQWVADVVGKNIVEAAAALPTDIVEAARERGRKMDMQEMAVELLADLTRGK